MMKGKHIRVNKGQRRVLEKCGGTRNQVGNMAGNETMNDRVNSGY